MQCPLNLGRAAATEPGGSVAVENPQRGGGPPVRDVIPSLSFRIDSLAPEVNKHLLRQLTGVKDSEQQKDRSSAVVRHSRAQSSVPPPRNRSGVPPKP